MPKAVVLKGLLLLIVDCLHKLESYTKSIEFQDFENNQEKLDACLMQLQVIGELCNKINKLHPHFNEIPYKEIIGLRNIISHDYFGVERLEIRVIIKKDIPKLKGAIEEYLEDINFVEKDRKGSQDKYVDRKDFKEQLSKQIL